MQPDELRDFMRNTGWTVRRQMRGSTVWEYIPTGKVYRLPNRPRDPEKCLREVVLLSPEMNR